MEIKVTPDPLLTVFNSKINQLNQLDLGSIIRVKVVMAKLEQALINWQGQEFFVRTNLSLTPDSIVDLIYEGTNEEGQQFFSLKTNHDSHILLPHEPVTSILTEFRIPPNIEFTNGLREYNRLANSPLDRQQIIEFVLLVRSGLPITIPNLRLWHQLWHEIDLDLQLAEAVVKAPLAGDSNPADNRQEIVKFQSFLTEVLQEMVVTFNHQKPRDIYQQILAKLAPQEEQHFPTAKEELPDLNLATLEKIFTKLIDLGAATKTLNALNHDLASDSQPLYLLIPIMVELLLEDAVEKNKGKSKTANNFRVTLQIPTSNLGNILAAIKISAHQRILELFVDSQAVAKYLRGNLASSTLNDIFTSVAVVERDQKTLNLKQRLLANLEQKLKPKIDLQV